MERSTPHPLFFLLSPLPLPAGHSLTPLRPFIAELICCMPEDLIFAFVLLPYPCTTGATFTTTSRFPAQHKTKRPSPPSSSVLLFSSPPIMLISTSPLSFCYRTRFPLLFSALIPCNPFTAETNCYMSKRLTVTFCTPQALRCQATGKSQRWRPLARVRGQMRHRLPSSVVSCVCVCNWSAGRRNLSIMGFF